MTTLREAAQQALEALKDCVKTLDALHAPGDSIYTRASDSADRAEIALRDALAQQTQTPCDIAEDGVCEAIDCCRKLPQILEALEIGYDSAQAEAAQYHAAMAGYRPERHAEMDANVAKIAAAITALRAALAQQEQEPVAFADRISFDQAMKSGKGHNVWSEAGDYEARTGRKLRVLYTHPPRREWRGLSEEDMEDLLPLYSDPSANTEMLEFAAAIEAKLKEKNA